MEVLSDGEDEPDLEADGVMEGLGDGVFADEEGEGVFADGDTEEERDCDAECEGVTDPEGEIDPD